MFYKFVTHHRVIQSSTALVRAWPKCRLPVTFGGGITIMNIPLSFFSAALDLCQHGRFYTNPPDKFSFSKYENHDFHFVSENYLHKKIPKLTDSLFISYMHVLPNTLINFFNTMFMVFQLCQNLKT